MCSKLVSFPLLGIFSFWQKRFGVNSSTVAFQTGNLSRVYLSPKSQKVSIDVFCVQIHGEKWLDDIPLLISLRFNRPRAVFEWALMSFVASSHSVRFFSSLFAWLRFFFFYLVLCHPPVNWSFNDNLAQKHYNQNIFFSNPC